MAIIGIDLGTTNSLVSVWKDNRLELIPNIFGKVLTPSVVSFDGDTVYVGQVAKERLISCPDCTVASFKRFMGTDQRFTVQGKAFLPEDLSSFVLRQLKEDAERYLGEAVDEAVISVPAYFNDDQRQATKNAGILAGLKVERLVNEPSAAALAGRALFHKNDSMLLIVDLGGGTLDVSVVECFENIVSVIAVSGDNHLGGDDFDRAIVDYFCEQNNLDFSTLDADTRGIIVKNAENCKIALSTEPTCMFYIETDKMKAGLTLTGADFVKICSSLFARIQQPIQRVLSDADISADEIDEVILVGGSCKMSIIKQFIGHVLQQEPLYIGEPDEVVARGVGIYAGIKARNEDIKDLLLTDICPFSLGVAVSNEDDDSGDLQFSPIIERNTVLPVSRTSAYVPHNPAEKRLTIQVYQGENLLVSKNTLLGQLSVNLPSGDNKFFDVCFVYDINGILNIEVTMKATGDTQTMTLLSKSGKKLSEKELAEKQLELSKIKKKTSEDEQMQFMIETSHAIYAQTTGSSRDELQLKTSEFMHEMKTQSRIKKMQSLQNFARFLNSIAARVGYDPFDVDNDFDTSWYSSPDDENYL